MGSYLWSDSKKTWLLIRRLYATTTTGLNAEQSNINIGCIRLKLISNNPVALVLSVALSY